MSEKKDNLFDLSVFKIDRYVSVFNVDNSSKSGCKLVKIGNSDKLRISDFDDISFLNYLLVSL